jgi:glutamine amidotransferase
MICIVDFGMGNLRSVQKGFEQVGFAAQMVSKPQEIEQADKIVLPGVGAFADGVAALRERGLAEPIVRHIKDGKPFLGICLGLQMLFEVGYEDGEHPGLGVLAGKCVRFDVDQTLKLKVPHMGWNTLEWGCASPLFKGLAAGCGVYFVHSYHVQPADASIVASTTDYGRPFVSSICRENLMATQFHPEKSQKVGLQILANFGSL